MGVVGELGSRLLAIATDNMPHFREHPKHLAWLMLQYDLLHSLADMDPPNPKDAIIDRFGQLSPDDQNLLYDAWSVNVPFVIGFPDAHPERPLESKPNKTLDEWVTMLTNPQYYSPKDQFSAEDVLLCRARTDYKWNKDGFIMQVGPSGVDYSLFAGRTYCEDEVREDIREAVYGIIQDERVSEPLSSLTERLYEIQDGIFAGKSWQEARDPGYAERAELLNEAAELLGKTIPEFLGGSPIEEPQQAERHYTPLGARSNLVTMSDNAHPSYVEAGRRIANTILTDSTHEGASQTYAREFLERFY